MNKFRFIFLLTAVLYGLTGCSSSDDCIDENCVPVDLLSAAGDGSKEEPAADSISNPVTNPVVNPQADFVPERAFTVADINHIVVVTGQSNVEASETTFDPLLDHPEPKVFAFTDEGWRIADLHQVWDEHAHPGNHSLTDPTRSPNNNLVFHFGKTLAQQSPDAVVAFIVLAAPGKGISNWDYESEFFLKMRSKITAALAAIPHRDKIDAMLWHQGESDWQFEGTSDPYATGFEDKQTAAFRDYYQIKLDSVITNFRSETWTRSDMVFICGETLVAEGVNRRLMALNNNGDPNSACVQAADLPFRLTDPTGNHFSSAGLRELGRRYMERYLAIVNR